mmetsp:Transcript_16225/g.31270  ORF Transcript_16225/g.31270 Transcript_16225/m.31270 type:complete len:251 (+) Transcript_16225:216-968(+)
MPNVARRSMPASRPPYKPPPRPRGRIMAGVSAGAASRQYSVGKHSAASSADAADTHRSAMPNRTWLFMDPLFALNCSTTPSSAARNVAATKEGGPEGRLPRPAAAKFRTSRGAKGLEWRTRNSSALNSGSSGSGSRGGATSAPSASQSTRPTTSAPASSSAPSVRREIQPSSWYRLAAKRGSNSPSPSCATLSKRRSGFSSCGGRSSVKASWPWAWHAVVFDSFGKITSGFTLTPSLGATRAASSSTARC